MIFTADHLNAAAARDPRRCPEHRAYEASNCPGCPRDVHGNTRASQQLRASVAVSAAQICYESAAEVEWADLNDAPDLLRQAREELTTASEYLAAIGDADMTGNADASPTTYADLAVEWAVIAADRVAGDNLWEAAHMDADPIDN